MKMSKKTDAYWTKLGMDELQGEAMELFASHRGTYIVAQALYLGIKALESVEPEHLQEKSNITDMKMLKELFPIPDMVFEPLSPTVKETLDRHLLREDEETEMV
jgi:hypothetical protein|tara:strand:+ start:495 stop:806 length:312 start_codon:yes stop_codon:yes gene_type:complete